MRYKKIIMLTIILACLVAVSAVNAADDFAGVKDTAENNILMEDNPEILQESADDMQDILGDGERQDLNISIDYPDEVVKDKSRYDFYPSQVNLKDVPSDYVIGSYDVYVDGKFEKTMYMVEIIESDEHAINLENLNYGDHLISVSLPGNYKYNPINLTHSFKLVESKINLPDEIVMGSYTSVSMRANTDATGYFIVNVDGKLFKKVKLTNGEEASTAYVDLSTLTGLGSHEIEAIYTGDSRYKQNSLKKTVNITYEMDLSLDYDVYEPTGYYIYGRENARLRVFLPDDVKNMPVVSINGRNYQVYKNEDNDFEVNVTGCPIGTHEVIVTYPGDSKYPQRTIMQNMNVIPKIIVPLYAEYDSGIVLRLPEDAQGNLNVYVNGEFHKSVPVRDGIAVVPIDFEINTYIVNASYDGADYVVDNESSYMYVEPKVTFHEMTYGEKQTILVEISPNSKCNITYMNKQEKLTIANGRANFTIDTEGFEFDPSYPSWDTKEFEIEYRDENGYEKTFLYHIHIKRIPSRLVAKDITMYYGESESYSVKVWGDYGKTAGKEQEIKIQIGSKTRYIRTDKNGMATFKVDMVPGTYKITASYHGSEITTKLVVKQPLSLKTAKVKRSAKKLVLQATLKKGKVPMKSKTVTFKFNGKTFKAKTDKRGVAKVTIKSSVLKKLKVGKKVTYQATYLKDTVKKTVKIKK